MKLLLKHFLLKIISLSIVSKSLPQLIEKINISKRTVKLQAIQQRLHLHPMKSEGLNKSYLRSIIKNSFGFAGDNNGVLPIYNDFKVTLRYDSCGQNKNLAHKTSF